MGCGVTLRRRIRLVRNDIIESTSPRWLRNGLFDRRAPGTLPLSA